MNARRVYRGLPDLRYDWEGSTMGENSDQTVLGRWNEKEGGGTLLLKLKSTLHWVPRFFKSAPYRSVRDVRAVKSACPAYATSCILLATDKSNV